MEAIEYLLVWYMQTIAVACARRLGAQEVLHVACVGVVVGNDIIPCCVARDFSVCACVLCVAPRVNCAVRRRTDAETCRRIINHIFKSSPQRRFYAARVSSGKS